MRILDNPMDSASTETLKKYMQHGEVVFIGPISDTMRPITEIDGNVCTLNNGNKINLNQCDKNDFAMITRVQL